MIIYLVVVEDRHSDTAIFPYLNKEQALANAEGCSKEQLEQYPGFKIDKTLYTDNTIYNWNIVDSGAQVQVIVTETQDK